MFSYQFFEVNSKIFSDINTALVRIQIIYYIFSMWKKLQIKNKKHFHPEQSTVFNIWKVGKKVVFIEWFYSRITEM